VALSILYRKKMATNKIHIMPKTIAAGIAAKLHLNMKPIIDTKGMSMSLT